MIFPAHAAEPPKIVVFGDSLVAGYGLPANQALPPVLQAMLAEKGVRVELVNAGVSGDTASAGLARLDWSIPDDTQGVILELGANDMLRGIDPAVTKATLDSIIKRLKERNIPVLLAGMQAAPNLGADYVQRFNAIYPELARTHGLALYPFFLEGVAGNTSLNLPDGLHPTAEGVRRIATAMLPTVEQFIASLPKR
ncbi:MULTISPECIES: arylesterase [unclassified Chelatococcus]|uniref:arylesterase n=1 Tax=unclassified Chelatococcus TaxID=2638111 RepID=UPI001BCFD687|nr:MULTISPECIES: arylesterase [unclassified Chelatococcus]MBS7696820.1 arylesterase [Chelatococcus sp. YT9]MBX3558342.1 arylesterase [Chelatococcus sp.]